MVEGEVWCLRRLKNSTNCVYDGSVCIRTHHSKAQKYQCLEWEQCGIGHGCPNQRAHDECVITPICTKGIHDNKLCAALGLHAAAVNAGCAPYWGGGRD